MAGQKKAAEDKAVIEPQPRVSRVSIGRLYSLGNYEHVRYDITVDVPEGASAERALKGLARVIRDLSPKGVDTFQLRWAKERLAKPETELNAAEIAHRAEDEALVKKDEELHERRQNAVAALDRLGGTSIRTDAKRDWEDDDDYFSGLDE